MNYLTPRPHDDLFNRALENAVYWQNRCCDFEEIIELLCMESEKAITHPKVVAPLTVERIREIWLAGKDHGDDWLDVLSIVRDVEAAHGITKGQPDTDEENQNIYDLAIRADNGGQQ